MQAGYHLQMTCYGCGKLGYIKRDCPAVIQRVHQQESRYRQLPQAQQQTRVFSPAANAEFLSDHATSDRAAVRSAETR